MITCRYFQKLPPIGDTATTERGGYKIVMTERWRSSMQVVERLFCRRELYRTEYVSSAMEIPTNDKEAGFR